LLRAREYSPRLDGYAAVALRVVRGTRQPLTDVGNIATGSQMQDSVFPLDRLIVSLEREDKRVHSDVRMARNVKLKVSNVILPLLCQSTKCQRVIG